LARSPMQGFLVGLVGLLVGAGLTQLVRKSAGFVLRREAMGIGDVDLMAMIGAFLGWQAAGFTFFLAPFFGLVQPAWKLLVQLKSWIVGGQLSALDHEIPFGPYLSMAAATLYFGWPWLWPAWGRGFLNTLYVIFWWLLGINLPG